MSPQTRREIARGLARAPLVVGSAILAFAWFVVTVPVLLAVLVVCVLPAELAWAASPFVGLISPSAGNTLAGLMEGASERLDRWYYTLLLEPVFTRLLR